MMRIFLIFIFLLSSASAKLTYDFSVHKMGNGKGHTLLLIGGIQGDEPGGFTAASLIVTKYKIKNGNVWVVPNLAFESIIKRSRGIYGDLNRKFAYIKKDDPDYETVQRIKKLITDEKVDLIVNLHDGSGFYRKKYESEFKNPNRWGQCSIIDQENLDGVKFGNLKDISEEIVENVNRHAIDEEHNYMVHNTKTAEGNVEMAKSLTWYAIKNKKPAFGNEASKNFLTHTRAYYHLLAVEGFMKHLDIEFEKSFELTPRDVKKAIDDDVRIAMNEKIVFPSIIGSRSQIKYVPLQKGGEMRVSGNNPLTAVVEYGNKFKIHYGNRRISSIIPEYFEYDDTIKDVDFVVDKKRQKIEFGSNIEVDEHFLVEPKEGYRVNIIGFTKKNIKNECGLLISKKDILEKFSIDKKGSTFRVEVYNEKNNKFAGMVLVKFKDKKI